VSPEEIAYVPRLATERGVVRFRARVCSRAATRNQEVAISCLFRLFPTELSESRAEIRGGAFRETTGIGLCVS
jgi:hypothetical protein